MFVPKDKAEVLKRPTCDVYGYGGTLELSFSIADIRGKYPDEGRSRNTQVDMTYYVVEGQGKFYLEDEVYDIKEGDLVLIEKGKWYRVEGGLKVIMASGPAWSPDQYEERNEP